MTIEDFKNGVGNFRLSVTGDADGNNIQTEIQGTTIAIMGSIVLLTRHVSKLIKEKDKHIYLAFMMAMFDALKGDAPEDEIGHMVEAEDKDGDGNVSINIKPDGMPNQAGFDAVMDKIFGEKRP